MAFKFKRGKKIFVTSLQQWGKVENVKSKTLTGKPIIHVKLEDGDIYPARENELSKTEI